MALTSTLLLALHLPIAAQVAPAAPADPIVAVEAPTATDRDRAILMLSGYHGIPSMEEFEAAFTNPHAVLLALAQDEEITQIQRDRAIGALAYWPTDDVQTLYLSLLDAPETPEMVRHRVIGHLATGFGDQAIDWVAPYLESDDLQFRLSAVHALGTIGTPAAQQRLQIAAQAEASQLVLEQIQQVTH